MRKILVALSATALALATVGCVPEEGSVGKVNAPVQKSSKGAKAKTSTTWGDGTYKVGQEIKPGTYRTKGNDIGCYWERLKAADGELDSVIANDVPVGPATMTVKKADKYVKFTGGCKWTQAKK